jgi:uncharacterized protein (TIGR02118 family)
MFMRRSSRWLLIPCLAAAAACGKSGDNAATTKGADTTASATAAPAEPMAIVTVFYNHPKSPAAFEKYYNGTHLPLLRANQEEIGFVRSDFTKFVSSLDGKKPPYYRQAELYFPSMDALKKGTASAGFKKIADDIKNFATGGIIGMVGAPTNSHEGGDTDGEAIVTVIYKIPKDSAAFEKYYATTHGPIVSSGQSEIGFSRAEYTRFESNLDGSKPALYRQAELYFPSMDALKKGVATPAFKKIGDDLANFATGGLEGAVGEETK